MNGWPREEPEYNLARDRYEWPCGCRLSARAALEERLPIPCEKHAQQKDDTKLVEILPCPFCASRNVYFVVTENGMNFAVCQNCNAEGPGARDNLSAVETWNLRKSE